MENAKALKIRTRSFLGGIVIGATLGFVLFEQSFRSVAIGGVLGGICIGSIGEAIVGGKADDAIGAAFVLGFIAGIVAAVTTKPFTTSSLIDPFFWGVIGVILGFISHGIGRITTTLWFKLRN